MKHYKDLSTLLEAEGEARAYYDKLPDYVREMMQDRADSINSYESLCHYADNLTKGDG